MDIEICTINDLDIVKFIMSIPDIKDRFLEDDEMPPDYEQILKDNSVYVLKIMKYNNPIGLFFLNPLGKVCYEVQTAILPQYRGKYALEATKTGTDWAFKNTDCQKIITFMTVNNRKAYALTKKTGMKYEGINHKSWVKGGMLHDQLMFGICKEDFYNGEA